MNLLRSAAVVAALMALPGAAGQSSVGLTSDSGLFGPVEPVMVGLTLGDAVPDLGRSFADISSLQVFAVLEPAAFLSFAGSLPLLLLRRKR